MTPWRKHKRSGNNQPWKIRSHPRSHPWMPGRKLKKRIFSRTRQPLLLQTAPKTQRRVIKKRKKAAPEKTPPRSVSDTSTLLPREEIMNIIHTMRNQGATYDQVAKHLVELGQPTFSGRGEWHAQTIHRLCGKK
jgi:hypothetical protein